MVLMSATDRTAVDAGIARLRERIAQVGNANEAARQILIENLSVPMELGDATVMTVTRRRSGDGRRYTVEVPMPGYVPTRPVQDTEAL